MEEDHDTFGHDSIGVSMKLIFEGEHGIPGQFKFIEDDECSLTGNQVTLE